MNNYEGEQDFTFNLTYMEACYLNAAVVDFFHKMKVTSEKETPVPHMDERYNDAKNLWKKIEQVINIATL
jgi:hypothetical protein